MAGSIGFRFGLGTLLAALLVLGARPAGADPVRAFQFALQNGLQVVVVPDHRAPVVTQLVVYKAGAVDDPPGLSGLAHLVEELMVRAVRPLPDSDGFAAHDDTMFRETVSKDKLRLAMHLEATRMAGLDLTDGAVLAAREAALDERRSRIDNDPDALLREQGEAALDLSHPYGRPVLGWPDEIRHIGLTEADDFDKRHDAPNNAVLIVVGDTTPDEVRADAEAEFATVPSRELAVRAEYGQPPRLGATRIDIVRKGPARFLRLYRTQSYAEAAPGQAEALEVLARLLGGGPASLLQHRLVTQLRLASVVAVTYEGFKRDAGTFAIAVTPRPGVTLEALERGLDEAIAQIQNRAPGKADLARAKAQLVAGGAFRHDGTADIALAYGKALAIGLTAYDVQQWPSRIGAVGTDDVRKAAAGLLARESVTATLTPSP